MRHAIRCERSRADRTGGQFGLLTYELATRHVDGWTTDNLLDEVQQRSRCIDTVGISGGHVVWIVLPNCPATAAVQIARETRKKFLRERALLHFEVYHYGGDGDADFPLEDDTACEDESDSQRVTRVRRPSHDPLVLPDSPLVNPDPRPLATLSAYPTPVWKRLLDIFAAGLGLLVLSPVFLAAASAIKLFSPGPIFFSQWRSGRNGVPFRIYKFRSMSIDAERQKQALMAHNERDGPAFKIKHDPRTTGVGRILRATNIDELPQLWNVLLGHMSLVGPRPLPCAETANCEPWHRERLDVQPGMTCFWQTARERSRIPFPEWMRMDIFYVRKHSLGVDLKLILRTIGHVIQESVETCRARGWPQWTRRSSRSSPP